MIFLPIKTQGKARLKCPSPVSQLKIHSFRVKRELKLTTGIEHGSLNGRKKA